MASVLPLTDPKLIMLCVLCLILGAPLLFERLRVPPLVGMVVAGMLVGPWGFGILERDNSFETFSLVGLYYIMFMAGLSMDTSALKQRRTEVVSFGLLSFGVPFALGYGAAYWGLHMGMAASVIVACILSSHTMVAFSIASRYGLARHRGVTLSVVATLISLLLSLFILAGLSGAWDNGQSSTLNVQCSVANIQWSIPLWLVILGKCALFVGAVLWGLPRLTRFAFHRLSDDVLQYIFVMCAMLLCAVVCDWLGLEGVLGAFLCGLVMNRYIPESAPLMRHIDFMGNALFIPYFLIGVGMLIDIRLMFESTDALIVTAVVVVAAIVSKCLSAVIAARIFRLDSNCRLMMCGLTTAHAAGALAIVMVGRRLLLPDGSSLVGDVLMNAVVMLILFSCIFSAFITSAAARRISLSEVSTEEQQGVEDKMLVALDNEEAMPNLVNTAILMRPHRSTTPLVGVRLVVDAVGNERELQQARQLVNDASMIAASAGISLKKVVRSSVNAITGLSHLMKDFETSEIVMDYSRFSVLNSQLTSELLTTIPRQITVVHATQPVNTLRRIHVVVPPLAEKETGFVRWLNHVLRLARQLDCSIVFYCNEEAWSLIGERQRKHYIKVKARFHHFSDYGQMDDLKDYVNDDHMVVIIAARSGSVSFHPLMHKLAATVSTIFSAQSTMIIYPDQYGIEVHNVAFELGVRSKE
ncbi:MAG: cation:proton antiporter [Bacteroidaceae bacterium]|nr:cation:proton antiporter [Bacteroidaceae bacterium]